MTQEPEQFLRMCSQYINTKYLGDPLGLRSFLNSVALLEGLTKDENAGLLTRFVVSKLDDKALEAITDPDNATLQQVKDNLKAKIKPDSSDVLEGRLLALRNDRMSLQAFAKQAEELTNSLKRTYIVEGMSDEKANEMTIKKTIELCRSNTHSILVKSVLSSTTFPDSKSVISKLLVESANDVKDKQILAFSSRNRNNRSTNTSRVNFRGNSDYRSNYGQNPRYNRNGNPNHFNNNNSQGRHPSNSNNFIDNNNSNRNNNNFNRNNNTNYRGRNRGNFDGNSRNASVRYLETGNLLAPQQRTLGEAPSNTTM